MLRLAIPLLIGAALSVISGCGDDGSSVTSRGVSYRASADTAREEVLELEGLRVEASCKMRRGQPYLSVIAATNVNNAVISSRFEQQDHGGFVFVLSDFDHSYGPWDFLGPNPRKTTGTLNYSRPDGGQVAIDFVADEHAPQGECVFGGIATGAPG
jgi:hypothetical protein